MREFFFVLGCVILDQYSKYWMTKSEEVIHVTNFFKLEFAQNTGIAFSIPLSQWIIIPLSFLIIFFLIKLLYEELKADTNHQSRITNHLLPISYCFILSGAIGNLIDRITQSYVIDFLSFWNFPIFNLADTYISIGIFLLIIVEIKKGSSKEP